MFPFCFEKLIGRSLDQSLSTTHGQSRIFLIVAQYCAESIWQADRQALRQQRQAGGWSVSLLKGYCSAWLSFAYWHTSFSLAEWAMDVRARWIKVGLWVHGLSRGGLKAAGEEMAGLRV